MCERVMIFLGMFLGTKPVNVYWCSHCDGNHDRIPQ